MKDRLMAVEVWFLRRMLKIPWTEKKSNEEVFQEAGVRRSLLKRIRQRQLAFLGHVLRRQSGEFGGDGKDRREGSKGTSETEVLGQHV